MEVKSIWNIEKLLYTTTRLLKADPPRIEEALEMVAETMAELRTVRDTIVHNNQQQGLT